MVSADLEQPDHNITGATLDERRVNVRGREFLIRMQRFENGMFISVSEGTPRIGSIAMSLVSQAGAVPVTTTMIPPRDSDSAFFLRMAAEQASSRTGGIAIVSVYARGSNDGNNSSMGPDLSKKLLDQIIDMTGYQPQQKDNKERRQG